ncbi:TonB-dependent siderophore receptor [Sphingobium sp. OAS761]|uniref:TonB-dependent siderophore receptor n=1 Tax=Sphingobium sp. OAS761 TaxID=2817901 RepID=UPI0020A03FF7|nr:TonB-dependent siderophore receptor [Sphingobium sp. OAS761]MCP1469673.1 TonB-dependent siderophore receptor [Sphingobium sp. OAS761]
MIAAFNARRAGRRRALRPALGALLLATAAAGAVLLPAGPATAQTVRGYTVPAGSLADAINSFAEQSGAQILYDAALTEGRRSPGLEGRFGVAEGLSRLLAGSGVTFRQTGTNIFTLELAPQSATGAIELGPVRVEGATGSGGVNRASSDPLMTEGTGSYTTRGIGVGGKTARDPRQIQQSVSVITQQRIQDQGLIDVNEALDQTTGITVMDLGVQGSQNIYSRGLPVNNVQFDGGSPTIFNDYLSYGLPDLAPYDHVEVLRGADGLFSGSGEAGATVNLVRKRPLEHSQVLFDALAGSWNHYRVQIDVTGPLAAGGRLRGRFVAAYEDRDYFYDVAENKKTVLYGIVEADLTGSTLLTLGASHEKNDSVPNGIGLPRYLTGEDIGLSRSTCICTSWSTWDTETTELFAKLEQAIGEDWTFKANLSRRYADTDARYAYSIGAVNPFTLEGPFLDGRIHHFPNRQTLIDANLHGRFALFGMGHELLLGTSWQDVNADGARYAFPIRDAIPVDIFSFEPDGFADPGEPAFFDIVYTERGQKQFGAYGSLRSDVTERLHTVIGLRYSEFEYNSVLDRFNYLTGAQTSSGVTRYKDDGVVTPFAGVTYDVAASVSLYASYSEIFKSQANRIASSGEPLGPITGASYEIGAKGSWADGRLTASLSAYRIERKNEGLRTDEVSPISGCCYIAAAEVRSQGVEAELTGEVLPGWQVFAGYTYNENRYETGYGANDGNIFQPLTPKHLFKLWTMVQLRGALSDLRLGGGINAQSKSFVRGTATNYTPGGTPTGTFSYDVTQDAYAIFSLRADYRLTDNWSAAINLNNIFDKTYYQTLLSDIRCCQYYGEPRNVLVSLRGSF